MLGGSLFTILMIFGGNAVPKQDTAVLHLYFQHSAHSTAYPYLFSGQKLIVTVRIIRIPGKGMRGMSCLDKRNDFSLYCLI